jgi:hypothetical protein
MREFSPRPEKFKKFDTLAQSPLHHLRAAHHLRHDRGYFRSAKIEAPTPEQVEPARFIQVHNAVSRAQTYAVRQDKVAVEMIDRHAEAAIASPSILEDPLAPAERCIQL